LNNAVEALIEALREGEPDACELRGKTASHALFTPEIAQRRASIHKFTDAVQTLEATLNALVGRELQRITKLPLTVS